MGSSKSRKGVKVDEVVFAAIYAAVAKSCNRSSMLLLDLIYDPDTDWKAVVLTCAVYRVVRAWEFQGCTLEALPALPQLECIAKFDACIELDGRMMPS